MDDYLVVLVTAGSENEAQQLARTLLEQKLIACANLLPVQSMYWWDDQIENASEVMMILKTTSAVFKERLLEAIQSAHSYDVPEIIGMPIILGSTAYLKWISDNVEV